MRETIRSICILIPAACLALLSTGCATYGTPDDFGAALAQAKADQTVNPGPPDLTPVTGLDGKWAAKSMTNYQDSPQPAREVQAIDLSSIFQIGEK